VAAIPISQSKSSLVAFVMPGAVTGSVSVTTSNGAVSVPGTFTVTATGVPANQQGAKLVGTGASGLASQGGAVSVSADGNTALVGGNQDNSTIGAAWVFTRSNGVWSQQGNKLVASDASGTAGLGSAVSLSADGNTALVGGNGDNSNIGAAWVFTRSNGVWSQQGSKLVASDASGAVVQQGSSVSLSADGNTALVGGNQDNSNIGAAWIFTRSNGVWSQQGSKLVASDASGAAQQGSAVSLSADGNTALIGGPTDNSDVGAAWVFTRSNGVWSQQGNKLVGTGGFGLTVQGSAVGLSADGNTALVGGPNNGGSIGGAWVYTRSNGVWTQQGSVLIGSGAGSQSRQGTSVGLSADGNTALIAGPNDFNAGAVSGSVWVFARSNGAWSQAGSKLVGTGASGSAQQGESVSLSADGNTALIGGPSDNGSAGATWVFTP